MNSIIEAFGSSMTTEQRNAAAAAVSRARENVEWLAYHGDIISDWLTEQKNDDDNSSSSRAFISVVVVLSTVITSLLFV